MELEDLFDSRLLLPRRREVDLQMLAAPLLSQPPHLLATIQTHLRLRRDLWTDTWCLNAQDAASASPCEDPAGSWSRRGDVDVKPLPRVLAAYLDRLSTAVDGAGGNGIGRFLEAFVGQPGIVRLRLLDQHEQDGSEPNRYLLQSLDCWNVEGVRGGGGYRRVRCMLHGEKSASMHYSVTSRTWHCYGCGAHETSVSLVARLYRLRDREAVDLIRRWHGLPPPPWPLPASRRNAALPMLAWIRSSAIQVGSN